MDDIPWNKPKGFCGQCSAPLNEYLMGGYAMHNGTLSVGARIPRLVVTASKDVSKAKAAFPAEDFLTVGTMTGQRYGAVVVLSLPKTDSAVERELMNAWLKEYLPTVLRPPGEIIYLCDRPDG